MDSDGDGDVDGDDAWRRLIYDHRWRVVAEHRDAETTPRLFYVHHAAGLDGRGTGSYIDQVICRERRVQMGQDGTTSEGGDAFNERLYSCQNWRADVVAMVSNAGRQVEQARYSAYGVPYGLPAGDADSSGAVDFFDSLAIQNWIAGSIYDVRGDLDLDGDVDAADASLANGMMGTTLGRGVLSRSSIGNRFGYAGYFYHGTVLKYHVRNRVYDPYSGRWITRDPIEYAAGAMNLYEYAASDPMASVDPEGLDVGRHGEDWGTGRWTPKPKKPKKEKKKRKPGERLPEYWEHSRPGTDALAAAIVWCCEVTGTTDDLASMSNGEVYGWSIGTSVVVGAGGYYAATYACSSAAGIGRAGCFDGVRGTWCTQGPGGGWVYPSLRQGIWKPAVPGRTPGWSIPVPMRFPQKLPVPRDPIGAGNCLWNVCKAVWGAI